jgi:dCMP deaminase
MQVPKLEENPNWNEFFIGMCLYASQKSKDRSTKLGAVVVTDDHDILSVGWNGFPRGVDDENEAFHKRPTKYAITQHAERNAITNAGRQGVSLKGSTLYLPFYPTPCTDCTTAILQAGIRRIVGTPFKFTGKGKQWDEDLEFAQMLIDTTFVNHVQAVSQTIVDVPPELDIRNFYKED